jgi:hypothetical protein
MLFAALALFAGAQVAEAQYPGFEAGISTGIILSTGKNDMYVLGVLRPGLFISEGFEVEAELGGFGSIYFDGPMTLYGGGNLQYHIPASRNIWPFLLAGLGATNSVNGHRYGSTITVLNLGAGVKFLAGRSFAVRVEYRFQQLSGGEPYDEIQGPVEMPHIINKVPAVDLQFHSVVIGTSIFF